MSAKTQVISELPDVVYTIEVCNKGNNPVTFPPTKTKLYPRWVYSNCMNRTIGVEGHKALAMEFRDGIPGMCVQLDCGSFVGRIFWPQSLSGNGEDIRKRMAAIYKQHPTTLGKPPIFEEPSEHRLDADGMKEWLYAMRRMVDRNLAVFVAGSDTDLPTEAVIKSQVPGRLMKDPFFEGDQDGTGQSGDNRPLKYKNDVRVPSGYGVDHDAVEARKEAELTESGAG